jgi:DNA-binding NarL/FixJ family response regulator
VGLLEPHGRSRRAFRRAALNETPPVFVVHSLTNAVAALSAAVAAERAITLLSAPDAGIYAGPGWFKALVDAARAAVPAARFSAVLDCGDDAGAAQGAIRAGVEAVVFTGRTDVAERLAAIAAASGSRLLTERPESVFDLGEWFFADQEALRRKCTDLLASLPGIC